MGIVYTEEKRYSEQYAALVRTNNNLINLTKIHDVRVDFLNRCNLHYIQLSFRYRSNISRFVRRGTSSSRYLYFHLFSRSFIF